MNYEAPIRQDFLHNAKTDTTCTMGKTISTMTLVLFVFENTNASVQLAHQVTNYQFLVTTLARPNSLSAPSQPTMKYGHDRLQMNCEYSDEMSTVILMTAVMVNKQLSVQ